MTFGFSLATVVFHWLTAVGVMTCVGTVKLAQWTPKTEPTKYGYTKGEFMNIHKSTALLVLGMVIPRIGARFMFKQVCACVYGRELTSASHHCLRGTLLNV